MLEGSRVLLVEDDAIVAQDLTDLIEAAGGAVIGPLTAVAEVTRLLPTLRADAAVLDVRVADGEVTPALEHLLARGIPVVVYTGGELPEAVQARHPGLVRLQKPVRPARLIAEIRKAMRPAYAEDY